MSKPFSSAENESSTLTSPPMIVQPRAHELEPLDVATHLHLLGESLSVIGSRLKEQNVNINNLYLNVSFFGIMAPLRIFSCRDKSPSLEAYLFC